ncbi:MAG: ABC transporter permease [Deltaproteobacteria bacterium]|nr:ABC transporter permease [Deltaproteobacteria bacterium]
MEIGIDWGRSRLRVPLTLTLGVLIPLSLAATGSAAAMASRILAAVGRSEPLALWAGVAVGVVGLLTLVLGVYVGRLGAAQPRGARGRGRLIVLGVGGATLGALLPVLLLALGWAAVRATEGGLALTFELDEVLMALPSRVNDGLMVLAALTALTALITLSADISAWKLLPRGARRAVWWTLDVGLLLAAAWVTWKLPASVPEGHPELTPAVAARLGVTAAFCIRLAIVLIKPLLALAERGSFGLLIAARHLVSKKSGFLATISSLSILAVAVSTAMLTTVLSVMGGFRMDLKQKILGNDAHVVVEREHGTFEGWEPTLLRVRQTPGVEAAGPFVRGEVMVSSTSNIAGAVVRGVDTTAARQVTDLVHNLTHGRLDYLDHPERLLDLPPEERRTILPLRIMPDPDTEPALDDLLDSPGDPGPRPRFIRPSGEGETETGTGVATGLDVPTPGQKTPTELDDAIRALEEHGGPDTDREVLPGVIVGQELARTLRLYVGDEIDFVSPLGELGPAGPMPKSRPFRVAGIFYSGMYEFDMKVVYVTLEAAQRFLNTGDAISGIDVRVDDVDAAPQIATRLEAAIGRPELHAEAWQQRNSQLFGALALEKLAMFVTLGIAILIAGFCVFGTLTLMVQEKSKEVGVLGAMGASRRHIVGIFLYEGLLIGLLGALGGLGLGFLLSFGAEHFGVKLNPEVYYIDRLPVHVDGLEFGLVGLAAVAVCLLATIVPATLASRVRPVDALRDE